jgi:hypothetical protein
MINEEILSALKYATERGQSLKNSMNALVNAGYKKKEVEEAANFLEETVSLERQVAQIETLEQPQISYEEMRKSFFKKFPEANKPVPVSTPIYLSSPPLLIPIQKKEKRRFAKLPVQEFRPSISREPIEYKKPKAIREDTEYYRGTSSKGSNLLIVLVSSLIFLVGVFILLLIFRRELINFFSSLYT